MKHPRYWQLIYQYMLDEINEGIHVINEHGESIIYNRKMAEIESMSPEDVLGRKLTDVFQFPGDQESTLLQALHQGKVSKHVRQTYFNEQKKEINTVNHTFPVVVNGQVVGAIEIANDVTKMERMLRDNISRQGETRYTFESIIGQSEQLKEVIQQAKLAARTSSSVLIVGETGTGKELFAQSIHRASERSAAPIISQNCAAIPEQLLEGLLFGTKKGAFTGAVERPGLFEQAEGGSLVLDEINALSTPLQAKLLRVLQEKQVRRLGDTKDKRVDVRLISTINEDPIEAIAEGRLRKDIYYRLGVVTLFIPPLRERVEDIMYLTDHFIKEYNELFQMEVKGVNEEVKEFFQAYSWPGNVRELQHVIEGAMNLIQDETLITPSHLPIHLARKMALLTNPKPKIQPIKKGFSTEETISLKQKLAEFERDYLIQILKQYQGNLSRAAKALGLSRQSLQYRLKRLKINREDYL